MNKLLKKILTCALAVVCALSLFACADTDDGDSVKGLKGKVMKVDDKMVYTIYKYVDDGETTVLDIGLELEKLDVPAEYKDNIKIKAQAFYDNDSLTDIIVPASVTEIEKGAFAGMRALVNLTVPFVGLNVNSDSAVNETAGSPDKAVDSERTIAHFFGDTEYDEGIAQSISYTSSGSSVTCYMPVSLKKITVKGDNDIPACAFNGLSKNVEIVLDGNVKVIGDYAFANTAQIAKITLPATVEKINKGAFNNATGLKEINLAQLTALTEIGELAFAGTALTEVKTPSKLDVIGVKAFSDCKSLSKVTLNNGLEKISRYAFRNCEKLQSLITTGITAGSVELGNFAFSGCEKLTTYDLAIYSSVGVNAFEK